MRDTTAWGVERGYWDAQGRWRTPPETTVDAILDAMGAGADGPRGLGDDNPVWVVRHGERVRVDGHWHLFTEDGGDEPVDSRLPKDLPIGYHRLRRETDGRDVRLIVAPHRCHLPGDLFGWGWAAQLYAARSEASWGIGDLGDLRSLGAWAADQGAGLLLINPLHAALPDTPQQPSPYYAGSRCFRNPLYLCIEDVPGADVSDPELQQLVKAGRALNDDARIDRDSIYQLKLEALENIWHRFTGDRDFDRYVAEGGDTLRGFAAFTTMSEVHGRPWSAWPEGLRRPDSPAVDDFIRDFEARIRFHEWIQWLLDRQLAAAGAEIPLTQDLAIGVDPAGADAWLWQDVYALGMRVGAPADEFNRLGQDWGFPPLDPWRLRLARFEPYIQTLRAMFRHSGGIRVDHVMGLFRLFWIPEGVGPADGTYVRYPWEELLDILALESVRAGAYVVGEDLGTVEDQMRDELAARNVLSYRLLWFEPDPPSSFPERSLGAITTHDLPTVAGLWSGRDLELQQALELNPDVELIAEQRARVSRWAGVYDGADPIEVVAAFHRLLAEAPSMLVTATLEDALALEERPNYPGTTDERPNWSMALPVTIDELVELPGPRTIAEILNQRGTPPAS